MMKLKKIFATLGVMSLLLVPVVAGAQSTIGVQDTGIQFGDYTGLGKKDVRITVASIIRTAMGLLGIVAVVIILIGGFKWMTSGGSEEGAEEGKKWIFSGIIGLAIILSAYALATYVINSLITATTSPV